MDRRLVLLFGELYEQKSKIAVFDLPNSREEIIQENNNERTWIINNLIQRFEVGLLQILERKLEVSYLESIPEAKARPLLNALGELIDFLDRRSNPDLSEPSACSRVESGDLTSESLYSNLGNLLKHLKEHSGPYRLTGHSTECLFHLDSEDSARLAQLLVQKLKICLRVVFLADQIGGPTLRPNVRSAQQNGFNQWIQSIETCFQDSLATMLDTMKSEFESCNLSCNGSSHQVRIKLIDTNSDISAQPQIKIDFYLLCKPDIWQCAQCSVDKSLCGAIADHPSLCKYLESSLEEEDGLNLIFYQNLGIYIRDSQPLPFQDPSELSFTTLENLIQDRQAFSLPPYKKSEQLQKFNYEERRALIAKLALHLSIFCPWRHTSTPWNPSSICFVDLDTDFTSRASPYILYNLNLNSSASFELSLAGPDSGLMQSFAAFAKLLLEVEFGQMPDQHTLNDRNLRSRVKAYYEQWKGYKDLSKMEYLEAVNACLNFHTAYDKARLTGLGRMEKAEQTYRRLIRNTIAEKIIKFPELRQTEGKRPRSQPLILEANDGFSDSEWGLQDDYDDAQNREPTVNIGPVANFSGAIESALRRIAESSSETADGQLHGDEVDQDTLQARQKSTDKRFKDFIKLLTIYKIGRTPRRLKVAILDSGIDLSHPDFNSSDKERIKETLSFIGGDPNTDQVGHGTHVAAIILRLTENVDLYIAKITDSKYVEEREEIAAAIKYARETWEVDMISMSFGFTNASYGGPYLRKGGIRSEISKCVTDQERDILVFASASNDTNEGWCTMPATESKVICAYSAKHSGYRSELNPPPGTDGPNFSFFGDQIRPTWGRRDLQDSKRSSYSNMQYKSGASYATPVAVSMAAFIIGFIELNGWPDSCFPYSPRNYDGMAYIFKMISRPVDGLDWISLTRFFKLEWRIEHIKTQFERATSPATRHEVWARH